jgi:hypothetical protein
LEERGITQSRGEGRMPPLEPEWWRALCGRIFKDDSNMVCMSDSATAYTSKPRGQGIVDAHHVNHSRTPTKEFARSVSALAVAGTDERRPAMCSTNLIDPTWRRLKQEVPQGGVTGRDEAGRERMRSYIRTGQWKEMLSTSERWGPFCAAA